MNTQPPLEPEPDDALYARILDWDEARAMDGQTVSFHVPGTDQGMAIEMQLVQVEQKAHGTPQVRQFSLVFRGPRTPQLAQRTYRVRHAQRGDFAIFITPIGQSAAHTDYEACFSHGA